LPSWQRHNIVNSNPQTKTAKISDMGGQIGYSLRHATISRPKWLTALFVVVLVLLTVGGEGAPGKKRKLSQAEVDKKNLLTGVTPSGSTKWKSEARGVIYTDVDLSMLGLDRVPKYFASVVESKRSHLVNATIMTSQTLSSLTNVTGKSTIVRPTNRGFRIRLRYNPDTGKNLTEADARVHGWRVRWAAVTEPHSLYETARAFVENGSEYESGIEDKPVGQSLAYTTLLERFIREDASLVQALVVTDYEKPASKRSQPKPKEETEKEEKTED